MNRQKLQVILATLTLFIISVCSAEELTLLDCMSVFETSETPVKPDAEKSLQESISAFRSGDIKSSFEHFRKAVKADAAGLIRNHAWLSAFDARLPFWVVSEMFLAAYPVSKKSPVFWSSYIHACYMAGQPELVLRSLPKLEQIIQKQQPGWSLQQAKRFIAIRRADALRSLGQTAKAYASLKSTIPELNDPDAIAYINTCATALLLNKQQLADVAGIDIAMLTGTYSLIARQFFHDLESGKYVEGNGKFLENLSDTAAVSPTAWMSLDDALRSAGWPESMIGKKLAVPNRGFKFAIIDSGFHGLTEWLQKHPEEKEYTSRIQVERGKPGRSSHGYTIYRVARKVMPAGTRIYCIEEPLKPIGSSIETFLPILIKHGIYYATYSMGFQMIYGMEPGTAKSDAIKLLEKHEITLFDAVANERFDNHFFRYCDMDADGVLEFSPNIEYIHFGAAKGNYANLYLSWNEWPVRKSHFTMEILDSTTNESIAKWTAGKNKETLPLNILSCVIPKTGWYKMTLTTDKLVDPARLRFLLHTKGCKTEWRSFNGLECATFLVQAESPFIIAVGSYEGANGKRLKAVNYSAIGTSNTGELIPHVMGPGKYLIDGKQCEGTSFATPFMAAMMTIATGHNPKNVLELISNHANFTGNQREYELSRHGIPSLQTLFKIYNTLSRVSDVQVRIDEENLIVEWTLNRKCMEGLTWSGLLRLRGPEWSPYGLQHGNDLKPEELFKDTYTDGFIGGSIMDKCLTKEITDRLLTVYIPLKHLRPEQWGQRLEMRMAVTTKTAPHNSGSSGGWIPMPQKTDVAWGTEDKSEATVNTAAMLEADIAAGKTGSKTTLALMLMRGEGVERNYRKAIRLLKLSAAQEDREAEYHLGFIYYHGLGVNRNPEKALGYYWKAAERGHAASHRKIAEMIYHGEAGTLKRDQIKKWLQQAAELGDAEAQFEVGQSLMLARPPDYDKALGWFKTAAVQKHGRAMLMIAHMCEFGKGMEKNLDAAIGIYKGAAALGVPEAQCRLVRLFLAEDKPEQQDVKEALSWCKRAVKQNHADGWFLLGHMLANGLGDGKDLKEAVKCFDIAANKGSLPAQLALAESYLKGIGSVADKKTALWWMKLAARRGFTPAQKRLQQVESAEKVLEPQR